MATLWELLTEIQDIVLRPDLDQLVENRVIGAIRACHAVAPCERDLVEVVSPVGGITPAPAIIGSAPLSTDFRTVQPVITALDANGNIMATLDKKSTTELAKLRRLGQDHNTYYVVGNAISFKAQGYVSNLVIAGYAHAPAPSLLLDPGTGQRLEILEANALGEYHDWITDTFDIAIIDYAVGYIEGVKGNKDLSNTHLTIFDRIDREDIIAAATLVSGH